MLQQTTTSAVIPHFERFLKLFPDLETLASSPLNRVLEAWSGLGYYRRAKLLHAASQKLVSESQFPRAHQELLQLPGFGPYTARSVASLAFDEPVGVVDGNVIRLLCRLKNLSVLWWNQSGRSQLQHLSDQMVEGHPSGVMNQAMMELGATICTPSSPKCLLCPIAKWCESRQRGKPESLPLQRPRRQPQIWIWTPQIHLDQGRVALIENVTAPFLKGTWIFPGKMRSSDSPPKWWTYRHRITNYDIYVQSQKVQSQPPSRSKNLIWVPLKELKQQSPSSLLQKALHQVAKP